MKKIIIRFNAPVILSFALLSLIALLLGNWTNGAATTQYFSVYRSSLADPLTYVRFFGHVLGHSGYDHYMGNMLLLLLVVDENNIRRISEQKELNEHMLMETRMRILENRTYMELRHLVHDLKSPLTSMQALVGVVKLSAGLSLIHI